ncbi:MAG: hydrogenase expression/formation protein HypE, partial [Calditrichaeota bacterium]
MNSIEHFSCPLLKDDHQQILLAHGAGGTLSQKLLQQLIWPHFDNPLIRQQHDGAMFDIDGLHLAFSTDSYVVQPLFFPGGDIGELAVNGTVNDLAMCGAQPLYLSCGLIIEEGLEMECLQRIIASMQRAGQRAGVQIVTGDTKVVDKGKGDKLFINTSGIGVIPAGRNISPMNCQIGDQVIISGGIAEHGMAVMSSREGINFGGDISSDTAALNHLVERMFAASAKIHVLRDPTRGGVASSLNEIAQAAQLGITIR